MRTRKYVLVITIFLLSALAGRGLFAQNLAEALAHLENERYSAAKAAFWALNAKSGNDAEFYYQLGKYYLINQQVDSAEAAFTKGKEVNGKYAYNYAGLAGIAVIKKEPQDKIDELLEEATDIVRKKDARLQAEVAWMFFTAGKEYYEKALEWVKNGLTINRKVFELHLYQGDIFNAMNNGSQANENYQNAINYNPKALRAYLEVGKIYGRIRNYAEAEAQFRHALEMDSTYAPAYRELAEMFNANKAFDKAVLNQSAYVRLSERTQDRLRLLMNYMYLAKDYTGSAAVGNDLLAIDANDAYVLRVMAFAYYETNDSVNSVKLFERLFAASDPAKLNAADYERYGRMQAKMGQDENAITNLKMAVQLDSTKIDLHGELSIIYAKLKRWKDAAKSLEMKIATTKKGVTANDYLLLGRFFYFDSNYAASAAAYKKVNEVLPNYAIGYVLLARAQVFLDPETDSGLARPAYEKFLEVAASDSVKFKKEFIEALSYLGYYWYVQSDKKETPTDQKKAFLAKSKECWLRVKSLDPADQRAIEALKTFK